MTTKTLESAIAPEAIIGLSNPDAAIGMARRLKPKAQPRFCQMLRIVA